MSEMESLGDAIGHGAESVYVRAIAHMKGWPVDQLPGGEPERDDRVESYSAMLAAHRDKITWDEANLISARCDAKWLLHEHKVRVALPKPLTPGGEAWRNQIMSYVSEGEHQSMPMADRSKLDEVSRRAFRENENAFRNWFRPIEEHQVRCERHYLALCAHGDTTDVRTCQDVFARGQLAHGQLASLKDSTLRWLPEFTFKAPGHDEDWRTRIGAIVVSRAPNLMEWWERFRLAREAFLPKRTPMAFVSAEPDLPEIPEPPAEEEPPPPEQPYGNFGERDEDVDLW